MFGYIKPIKDELKVRDFEQFKACYCGLCHTLGREYGVFARFILNYDFIYLVMLLWPPDDAPEFVRRRCIASPCRRKRCCKTIPAMERAAGYSLLLARGKLLDSLADKPFWRSLPDRAALLLLHRAFKKARARHPDYDETVGSALAELKLLEDGNEASLDRVAHQFAVILAGAASGGETEAAQRVLHQILYHTGRFIYIADACDDLAEDAADGQYNPVSLRFSLEGDTLTEEAVRHLESTLQNSQNLISSAFELLPETTWTETLRNIIYLSLPVVRARVLSGEGKRNKTKKDWNKTNE